MREPGPVTVRLDDHWSVPEVTTARGWLRGTIWAHVANDGDLTIHVEGHDTSGNLAFEEYLVPPKTPGGPMRVTLHGDLVDLVDLSLTTEDEP